MLCWLQGGLNIALQSVPLFPMGFQMPVVFIFKVSVCVGGYGCMHRRAGSTEAEEVFELLGPRVMVGCELSRVGAGVRMQGFWKSRT